MSPSAQVSDDEDKSDGQGTVYGDAETQKAENKSVMMMMKVRMKALRMGGDNDYDNDGDDHDNDDDDERHCVWVVGDINNVLAIALLPMIPPQYPTSIL